MVAQIVAVTPPTGGSGVTLSSTDVTIPTISGYTPMMGDVAYVFLNCGTALNALNSFGWTRVTQSTLDADNVAILYRKPIPQTAVNLGSYSDVIIGAFASGASGRGVAAIVRGGGAHVAAAGYDVGSTHTPQPVVSGSDGSVVLAYVAPDDVGRGINLPGAGWTSLARGQANAGVTSQMLMRRDALAPAGYVGMGDAAVTLGASDGCAGVTLSISPQPSSGGFFACL